MTNAIVPDLGTPRRTCSRLSQTTDSRQSGLCGTALWRQHRLFPLVQTRATSLRRSGISDVDVVQRSGTRSARRPNTLLASLAVRTFAPPRWAILAWLIMGNLDTTGGGGVASTSVGWANASKGILLPLYLWWRLRKVPGEILFALPARLWIALALYAGVDVALSPFPLAAVKMVGNMVGILPTFVGLEWAARCGYLSSRVLAILILVSLGLGVVQTLSFKAYGFDGMGRPTRFSSFVTAQQYAASLVAFFAVSVRHPGFRLPTRMFLVLALGTALFLNGSRTWFIGAAVIVLIYLWQLHARILAFRWSASPRSCSAPYWHLTSIRIRLILLSTAPAGSRRPRRPSSREKTRPRDWTRLT